MRTCLVFVKCFLGGFESFDELKRRPKKFAKIKAKCEKKKEFYAYRSLCKSFLFFFHEYM